MACHHLTNLRYSSVLIQSRERCEVSLGNRRSSLHAEKRICVAWIPNDDHLDILTSYLVNDLALSHKDVAIVKN